MSGSASNLGEHCDSEDKDELVDKTLYFLNNMHKPPRKCFSCGRDIPEKDYDKFHSMKKEGKYTDPCILDKLKYFLPCCRRMLLGDNKEYREIMTLYKDV